MLSRIPKNVFVALWAIVAVFAMMFNILGTKLFQLNSIQWDTSGDGFKNLFNFAYHYKHGKGVLYEGMFYPYGEYLTYTDAQPAILLFFKLLKNLGIDFTGYELFLVQGLPICGFVVAFYFFFKLFDYYKIPFVQSLVFSTLILFLSPQLVRIQSHYSLSYVFFFPMLWYWSLIWETIGNGKKWLFSFSLFVTGFVHPYVLLILVAFLSLQWLFQGFKNDKNWSKIICILLAFLGFYFLNEFLDPYSDRPSNPGGLSVYKSEVSDLFPFTGWFHTLFAEALQLRNIAKEGYAYAGVLIFLMPWILVFNLIKGKKYVVERELRTSLYSAIFLLLFALGLHMILFGDYTFRIFPPLKQFRSIGRFAWIFYYCGLTTMLIYFYRFLKGFSERTQSIVLSILIVFYGLDSFAYHKKIGANISQYKTHNTLEQSKNLFKLLEETGNSPDSFQAILSLPSGSEGSEKLRTEMNWHVKIQTLPLSYQTGLPSTNVILSRNSLSRCLKINQLGSSQYLKKEILEDLTSNKDFLTVVHNSDVKEFKHILENSSLIGKTKELQLFRTPVSYFEQQVMLDDYPDENFDKKSYEGFEAEGEERGLYSLKAILFDGENLLIDKEVSHSEEFEATVSVWFKVQANDSNIPTFKILAWKGSDIILTKEEGMFQNKSIEIIGPWIQMKMKVNLPSTVDRISFIASGTHQIMDHAIITSGEEKFVKILTDNRIIQDHYIMELGK